MRGPRAVLAALVACGAVLGACGNAKASVTTAGNADGVAPHSVLVGGVASLTGPIPADFAPVFDGASAYFDMVNAEGGVDGRRILYPAADQLDDGSNPAQDVAAFQTLVDQDHVFAVVGVATPSFAGASFLVRHDVPTFGYDVNPQWSLGDNLFGSEGSFIDFLHPGPEPAYLAERVGARRAAVLAYDVSESQQGCEGIANVLREFRIDVAYEDLAIPAPAVDLTSDVNRMRAAGVDFVASCMDLSGNILLSETLRQAGMGSVVQYWLNGYDERALHRFASLMDGVYFLLGHVPFEVARLYPGRYPGMDLYLRELARYFPGELPSEASLAGWIDADLFVKGLRMVGRDLTRTRLVRALNSLTSFTADGIVSPVDWRDEHHANGPIDCNVFVQVRAGHFVPVFGSSRSVFTCFAYPQPPGARHVVVIPPPPGVPPS